MRKNSIFHTPFFFHILFWLLYISSKVAFENIRRTIVTDSIDTFCITLIYIGNFYYVLILLHRFFQKRKLLFFLLLLAGYLIYIPFLYFYCKVLIRSVGHGLYYSHLGWVDAIVDGTDFYLQFLFYAIGFWYISRTYKSQNRLLVTEKENLQLKNDKLALENEKVTLEYNYLKSQVNPHFLYNTLGCFHGEAAQHSEKLAEGIAHLASIMRYALHENGGLKNVPLTEEINHLKEYIDLHRMRYNGNLPVNLDLHTERSWGITIPPFILITLAENAFKHGTFKQPEHLLAISLKIKNTQLRFRVRNKAGSKTNYSQSTGVGLSNVQKILKLAYGENHKLTGPKALVQAMPFRARL